MMWWIAAWCAVCAVLIAWEWLAPARWPTVRRVLLVVAGPGAMALGLWYAGRRAGQLAEARRARRLAPPRDDQVEGLEHRRERLDELDGPLERHLESRSGWRR